MRGVCEDDEPAARQSGTPGSLAPHVCVDLSDPAASASPERMHTICAGAATPRATPERGVTTPQRPPRAPRATGTPGTPRSAVASSPDTPSLAV
eukprot:6716797-Prymnesium_polylepis.1